VIVLARIVVGLPAELAGLVVPSAPPLTRRRIGESIGVRVGSVPTHWEEGRAWAWRVAGVPATGHRVTPLTTQTCRVAFTIPRWTPFYLPVCRLALRRLEVLATGHGPGD